MKSIAFIAGMLMLIAGISMPGKAKADHCAGGEIAYQWLSDSTYRFYFKFYRDCTGIAEDGAVTLCYRNTCDNKGAFILLTKLSVLPDGTPNGSLLNTGCFNGPTKCTDPSSTIPGFREWWYTGVLTLPSRCDHWLFTVVNNYRNSSENLVNTINPIPFLSLQATLNNQDAQGNSSPVFSVKPIPYTCINNGFTFNNGVIDPDGDKLEYELVQPEIGSGCPFVSLPATFKVGAPPYNLTNNPFQTNNSFGLNTVNGQMTFTPTLLGPQTIAIKVKEFRKGVLIGTVIRDLQIQVLGCNPAQSNATIDQGSLVNCGYINNTVEACINVPFTFCYYIKATPAGSKMVVRDNHFYAFTGSSSSYTNQAHDSVRGCFTWTPGTFDTGLRLLTLIVKDSTCFAPGIAISQSYTLPIHINTSSPPPSVISPVSYCINDAAVPLTVNGVNPTWYTSATGGVGSPTAPTPGTAVVGGTYYYVSQRPNGCESPRMPILVTVDEKMKAKVFATKDSICQYEAVEIRNIATNPPVAIYMWDVDTGTIINGAATPVINAAWSSPGKKRILLRASNGGCHTYDSAFIYVKPAPIASFELPLNICLGDTLNIVPRKEDGYYHWKADGIVITDTIYRNPLKLSWNTTGIKHIQLSIDGKNGCKSKVFDTTVTIHDYPKGGITDNAYKTCAGDTISIYASQGMDLSYEWSPQVFFLRNNTFNALAKAEKSGYVFVKIANRWGCTINDTTYLAAENCCNVTLPDAFTPNGDGRNDFFKVITTGSHQLLSFVIQNRWGQTIFKTTNLTEGWDGTYKNVKQDAGTYFYILQYKCDGRDRMEKIGNFTLIR